MWRTLGFGSLSFDVSVLEMDVSAYHVLFGEDIAVEDGARGVPSHAGRLPNGWLAQGLCCASRVFVPYFLCLRFPRKKYLDSYSPN